jgi:hypothetical protein
MAVVHSHVFAVSIVSLFASVSISLLAIFQFSVLSPVSPFALVVAAPINSPGPSQSQDFKTVANRLLRYLKSTVLKLDQEIFQEPPDNTTEDLKDYYDVVPHGPMAFSIMERKLENEEYETPREFYEDVFKMCDNCYQYNMVAHPVGWYVGTLGIKIENAFANAWANTVFAEHADPERKPRRMPKPSENPNKPVRTSKLARSSSVQRQPSRTHSQQKVYMTAEMENDLVSALNTPEILEANMEAVVNILTEANEMGTDEDGEPSLDLEKVSAPTKRKLYDLVVRKPTNSGGANPTTSGFQMDDDDDFDDE